MSIPNRKYKINGREYVCAIQLGLSAVFGKWKGLIVWIIQREKIIRYSDLKREINFLARITDKMLIQSLRELESDGLVERKVYPVVPPKVEYRLTDTGLRLKPIIEALGAFGAFYEVKK